MGRFLLIFACALFAFQCSAQVDQTSAPAAHPGSIVGTVVDEDGKPVLGPEVSYSVSTDGREAKGVSRLKQSKRGVRANSAAPRKS
jgi:hypothetical protein